MDPAVVCRMLGGIARTGQLKDRGVSRRSLSVAVRVGTLVRIREGIYADVDVPGPVRHAVRHGGRLACLSAMEQQGAWVLRDDRLHIGLRPDGHTYEHAGCEDELIRHWDEPAAEFQPASTSIALAQLSGCGSSEQFLVALESALNLRLIRPSELPALRRRVAPHRRTLLDVAAADVQSGLESLVRWRLRGLGVVCRPQVAIPGVGRVDLLVGDRLILELDGREHHAIPAAFELDRRRDVAATALGFHTLRFTYGQVMHDWTSVEAAVMAVVDRGLHESDAGRRYRQPTPVRVRGVPPRHSV